MLLTQQASWKIPTLEAVSVVIISADSDQQHFHLVHFFADLGKKTWLQLSLLGNIIHHQNGLLALSFVQSITISATGALASTELALVAIRWYYCDALCVRAEKWWKSFSAAIFHISQTSLFSHNQKGLGLYVTNNNFRFWFLLRPFHTCTPTWSHQMAYNMPCQHVILLLSNAFFAWHLMLYLM